MPRITSKGQVTIPKHVRESLGLKPGSEVAFQYVGSGKFMVTTTAGKSGERERFKKALAALAGNGDPEMSTDEIMRLTRGWGEDDGTR